VLHFCLQVNFSLSAEFTWNRWRSYSCWYAFT